MDLRSHIAPLWARAKALYREQVAPRPMLAGGVVAALIGAVAGLALSAGLVWERPPQRMAVVTRAPPPAPVAPMVDETGRTPDYVIGTDNLTREPNPDEVIRVIGPPTPRPEERRAEAEPRASWWRPWTWGRGEREDADRYAEARDAEREARREFDREARLARREAEREARRDADERRYQERLARYEADLRAHEDEMERRARRYADEERDYYADREERSRPRYGY